MSITADSLLAAPHGAHDWRQQRPASAWRTAGVMVALLVHALLAWAVLSGTGVRIVQEAVRKTTVYIIPPADPTPPAPRLPDPPRHASPSNQRPIQQTVVPVAEETPIHTMEAPIVTSQPSGTTDGPPSLPSPPGTSPAPTARGFGAITNRAECSAAFTQSFPREARRNAQQGTVTLQVRVSPAGAVMGADVIDARPRRIFDRAALGVILSGACRFEADTAGYIAVLEVSYHLNGESPD